MPKISDERLAELEKHAQWYLRDRADGGSVPEATWEHHIIPLIADLREARADAQKVRTDAIELHHHRDDWMDRAKNAEEQLTKAETALREISLLGANTEYHPPLSADEWRIVALAKRMARAYFTAKDAAPKGDRS